MHHGHEKPPSWPGNVSDRATSLQSIQLARFGMGTISVNLVPLADTEMS